MSAVRLLSRAEVHAELNSRGCRLVKKPGAQLELWDAPWGFLFSVSYFSDDDWCAKRTLYEILADVERMRPTTN